MVGEDLIEIKCRDEKKTLTLDKNRQILLKEWLPEEDQSTKGLAVT